MTPLPQLLKSESLESSFQHPQPLLGPAGNPVGSTFRIPRAQPFFSSLPPPPWPGPPHLHLDFSCCPLPGLGASVPVLSSIDSEHSSLQSQDRPAPCLPSPALALISLELKAKGSVRLVQLPPSLLTLFSSSSSCSLCQPLWPPCCSLSLFLSQKLCTLSCFRNTFPPGAPVAYSLTCSLHSNIASPERPSLMAHQSHSPSLSVS